MPRYVNTPAMLDGLNFIKANATKLALISAYAVGDSFATVNTRTVASAVMAPADFTLRAFGTNERELEVAAKTLLATAASGAGPDLHLALLSATAVLAVANETSNQVIVSGNSIAVPAWVIRGKQPTRWLHQDVMDGGLNVIKNNATKLVLTHTYTAGDSYATVNGKIIATATVAPADLVLTVSANQLEQILTVATKSVAATVSSPATPVLSVALMDATRVLYVGVESTNQAVTAGNTVVFPSFTVTWKQPL